MITDITTTKIRTIKGEGESSIGDSSSLLATGGIFFSPTISYSNDALILGLCSG